MSYELKCLVDTFSWSKLFRLRESGWEILLETILKETTIMITHEVKKEIEYRAPSHKDILEKVTILPKIDIDYPHYERMGFDPADASLFEYQAHKNLLIISEDHPMLALGSVNKTDIIQLADFFSILNSVGILSNNDLHKLLVILRDMKNISKRKFKYIKDKLKE